jgi:hypothetical protein
MATLTKMEHNTIVRAGVLISYIGASTLIAWNFYEASSFLELLDTILLGDVQHAVLWIGSFFLLGIALDYTLPKKAVVFCSVTSTKIVFYPNSLVFRRWRIKRPDVAEIREVDQGMLSGRAVYIFLKTGRFRALIDCRGEDVVKFLEFAESELPEVPVHRILRAA